MNKTPKARILCPACRKGLLKPDSAVDGSARCSDCNTSFPIKNGILDLLPHSAYERGRFQWFMEWEPIISIYESRLWRRSFAFAVATGVSFDREQEIVIAAAKLKGDEILLDLACGPGIYSRPLAQKLPLGYVVGLDISEPMLNHASLRAREEGIENLTFIHGSASDLPFPNEELDVVNCCGAIYLFPDVPRALGEIYRVLKPGGRFTASGFKRSGSYKLSEIITEQKTKRTGVRHYLPQELGAICKHAGLTNIECHYSKRRWMVISATK